jgi:acyl-CoA reductase-like NAD-dependent aldehyde dehydrogenase
LVHKDVKEEFLGYMKQYIHEFYGTNPQESPDYGRIVNQANVDRLQQLMHQQEIYTGGNVDRNDRYIAPTILTNITGTEPIMQEEIFGPIFPVVEFEKITEAVRFVNDRPKPLALYLFSKSKKIQEQILEHTSSGGVCINEVVMHVANDNLPFGGVGNSGMGVYHGKYSFEAFSHYKPVLNKSNLVDVPVRYAPYNGKIGLAKTLMS